MDFTLGVITGIYAVVALFISYIVYIIEVKLDLPALVNGHHLTSSNTSINNVLHTNHNNNTTFIDVSQTRLRQLIETIIAETLRFPVTLTTSSAISEVSFETHRNCGNRLTLSNGDAKQRHRTEHYFEPKIYQELLATAVLNKIADKHGNVHRLSESSPDFTTPDANQNFKDNPKSSSSGSSIGPRSDFSFTDNDQNLLNLSKGDDFSPYGSHSNLNTDGTTLQLDAGRESALSDYIAAHLVPLPDLSAPATESEEDDYNSATSNQVGEGNWEDNWLFKKKKTSLSSSVTVGSVGMLVPAPKDDVRAQIGDKIADDISDLSEMGSDTDDSSLELLRDQLDPLNDRLLNKHLIGGKNTKLVLDELMERTSMMSNTTLGDNEPIYTETKNEQVCKSTTANPEAINKDVTKSILQSSPPSIDTMTEPSEPVILLPPCNFDDEGNISTFSEDLDTINTTAGSIAEREYKKWYNAVDMPNNPYAPDALKRRISGSQEKYIDLPNITPSTEHNPISLMESESENEVVQGVQEQGRDYKRYSRDYYINDTKVGSIKPKTLSVDYEQPDITVNEAANTNPASFDITSHEHIFQALPAQVLPEQPASLETQSTLSNQSVQSTTTTTSDELDTIRVYDFNKQETTVIREATTKGGDTNSATQQSVVMDTTTNRSEPKAFVVLQRKERPTELPLGKGNNRDLTVHGASAATIPASTVTSPTAVTPSRGSTPTAFKFLQPKRKLIHPSQVLSFDEDDVPPSTPSVERKPIEDDVAQALPSVKALAQAFLMTSHKCPQVVSKRRWSIKPTPTTPTTPTTAAATPEPHKSSPPPLISPKILKPSPSFVEGSEDATIASDLSSLETDSLLEHETKDSEAAVEPPVSGKTSPVPVRSGFLRSNIAFFENLKFK